MAVASGGHNITVTIPYTALTCAQIAKRVVAFVNV